MGAVCADKCQSYSEPRNPTQAVRALHPAAALAVTTAVVAVTTAVVAVSITAAAVIVVAVTTVAVTTTLTTTALATTDITVAFGRCSTCADELLYNV